MKTLKALTLSALLLAAAPAAFAQDSDGDTLTDATDAFPCDATMGGVLYAPSQSGWTTLAFEDQWPAASDLDFNDVVVRAHYQLYLDAAGNVQRLMGTYEPLALGGTFSNGLAVQLPVSKTGATARRRVAGGAWTALNAETDNNLTVVLSNDLRELYGNASGPINSDAAQPTLTGEILELEVVFSTPVALDTSAAPYDVFIFRAGDFGHQIHRPSYAGTAAMNGALFNTGVDNSSSGHSFVHNNGTPFALNLAATTVFPLEGVAIDQLFPLISNFAATAGAQDSDFYARNVVTAMGKTASGAVPPVVNADTTCTVDSDGDGLTDGEEALGGTDPQDPNDPAPPGESLSSVYAGGNFSCGFDSSGDAVCWGSNEIGQLSPPAGPYLDFSLGHMHGCAIDMAGALDCWGWDRYAQASPPAGTFVQVSSGQAESCAIDTAGHVHCWGRAALNPGDAPIGGSAPAPAPGGVYTKVSVGDWGVCAIDINGVTDCWGGNHVGQHNPPAGVVFTDVDVRGYFACGLDTVGEVHCWGDSGLGQTAAPAGPFVSVQTGYQHACAQKATGELQCWGWNNMGQLNVPAGTYTSYATGAHHTCGEKTTGEVLCWGYNDKGQINVPASF